MKNTIISGRILSKMSEGLSVPEAVDAVLGEGTYEKVASDVYDKLRRMAMPGCCSESERGYDDPSWC